MPRSSWIFVALDRDGDGQIARADLEHVVVAMRLERESEGWRRLRAALGYLWELVELSIDRDDSGTVHPDELEAFVGTLADQVQRFGGAPPALVDVVQALWTALDADNDGRIVLAELVAVASALGVPGDASTFAAIDADGDGRIDIDELERHVVAWLRA